MDNSIMVEFRYLDDAEQRFRSAHLPGLPRIGDFVSTPPPLERRYRVVSVCFQCGGGRDGESYVEVELRSGPPSSADGGQG